MVGEATRLRSTRGADLALRHAPATGAARGILLVSHGLAEHAGRYCRFASDMASRGLHVYAHDHRGHGATVSPDNLQARFAPRDGIGAVLADLADVRDHALARHTGLPVVLFGHSMGGLIALNAAEAHPERYDAIAVWNANFHPGMAGRFGQAVLAVERMLKGSDVPSRMMSRLTFDAWARAIPGRRTDGDWLSHDPAEVDAYLADPLCGFEPTVSLWIDLFRMSFRGGDRYRLKRLPQTLPIHLVGGKEDPATQGGRDVLWLANEMRAAGLRDVTTRIYPGARHETLHDTVRTVATADFAAWVTGVTDRLGGRPSSAPLLRRTTAETVPAEGRTT